MFPLVLAMFLIYLLDKLSYHLAFLFRLSILQSIVLQNVNMPLAVISHLLVFVLIKYIKNKRCISLVNIKSRCRHLVIRYIYLKWGDLYYQRVLSWIQWNMIRKYLNCFFIFSKLQVYFVVLCFLKTRPKRYPSFIIIV